MILVTGLNFGMESTIKPPHPPSHDGNDIPKMQLWLDYLLKFDSTNPDVVTLQQRIWKLKFPKIHTILSWYENGEIDEIQLALALDVYVAWQERWSMSFGKLNEHSHLSACHAVTQSASSLRNLKISILWKFINDHVFDTEAWLAFNHVMNYYNKQT